jgi:uncharacterized membrane protein YozB (DUF420 family)
MEGNSMQILTPEQFYYYTGTTIWETLESLLIIIIPIALVQLVLLVVALVDIFRHSTYKRGNRTIWVLVSFIGIIGPILYFTLGKGDD